MKLKKGMFLVEGEHKFSQRVQTIRFSGIRKLFDLAQKMEGIISLGIGEPDFGTPTHIKEAAKRALDEGYTHYTPNAGFSDLREALSEKVQRENGLDYSPDEVIVSDGGCTGSFLLAMLALVDPGEEVIVSNPYFVVHEAAIKIAGATPIFVPLNEENDFRMLPEDVESAVSPKTKMIVINSPCNPTGGVLRKEDFEGIAEIARRHDLYVLADEVYEKMVYEGMRHYSIASFDHMRNRTVTVNSFSKTYAMTGWRIGYAVGDGRIIDQMVKLQQYTMVHAPAISQRAAIAALKGPQDFVMEMVQIFDKRRRFITDRLNEIKGFHCLVPKGAFYVFPNIESLGKTSEELADFLVKEGYVVTCPGSAFGSNGEGYLRISYARPLDQLQEACDRVEHAISNLPR